MQREYPPAPVVAVVLVVVKGDRVLLVRLWHEPNKGRWSIPGGVVELGEGLRAAAQREVYEECCVIAEAGRVVEVLDWIQRDETGVRYHYVIIDFLARYVGGEPRPGGDSVEVRWVSLSELEELDITDTARPLIRRALLGEVSD